jgi:hypothetical protein
MIDIVLQGICSGIKDPLSICRAVINSKLVHSIKTSTLMLDTITAGRADYKLLLLFGGWPLYCVSAAHIKA